MSAGMTSNEELVKLAEALDGVLEAKVIAASDVKSAAWVRL